MVKATELRVGNLVTLSDKQRKELWDNQIHAQNKFFEVKTIYSDNDIALELDDEIVDINEVDVDTIPFTEEWLLKFGFKDNEYSFDLKAKTKKITASWYSRVVSTGVRNGFYIKKYSHIKYVHQLQNLYFALTGEELTLKN